MKSFLLGLLGITTLAAFMRTRDNPPRGYVLIESAELSALCTMLAKLLDDIAVLSLTVEKTSFPAAKDTIRRPYHQESQVPPALLH